MKSKAYDRDYFDSIKSGSLQSAREIIPLIQQYISPNSVVDVGCGIGTWLLEWQNQGVKDIYGIDGDYIDKKQLLIPNEKFETKNLERQLALSRTFDLAMSLEVAEHLQPEFAASFIQSLCNLSEIILFSAAIPHQGGVLHYNEQYPGYWINLFAKQGFSPFDCLREKIWENKSIDVCYRQNLLFFVKNEVKNKYQAFTKESKPVLSMVHPEHFEFKEQTIRNYQNVLKTPFHAGWFFLKKYLKALGLKK